MRLVTTCPDGSRTDQPRDRSEVINKMDAMDESSSIYSS